MHPFLESFISADFSDNLKSKDIGFQNDNFNNWITPAIKIPKFDLDIIQKLKTMCEQAEDHFVPTTGSYINNNWYSLSGADSWKEILLLNAAENEKIYSLVDGKMSFNRNNNEVIDRKDILNLCLELIGFSETTYIKSIRIVTVDPGGYIHPHKDKLNNIKCLWMPLHDFSWCLKFYPFGWLMHELGNAYLINNREYVHAVLNNSREKRYVLNIDFYDNPPDKKLLNWYFDNSDSWKNIFTNNIK